MTLIEYDIPLLGNFGVTYLEEELMGYKPGYYGTRGTGFITRRCESGAEAEIKVFEKIFELATKEMDKIEKKKKRLTEITSQIRDSGNINDYRIYPKTNPTKV